MASNKVNEHHTSQPEKQVTLSIRHLTGGLLCSTRTHHSHKNQTKESRSRFIQCTDDQFINQMDQLIGKNRPDHLEINFRADSFVLIPPGMEGEDRAWWQLTQPDNNTASYVLSESLGNDQPTVACGWLEQVADWADNLSINCDLKSSIAQLLRTLLIASRKSEALQLGVELFDGGINIALCSQGKVLMANRFDWPPTSNVNDYVSQVQYFVGAMLYNQHSTYSSNRQIDATIIDGAHGQNPLIKQFDKEVRQYFNQLNWSVQ